VRFYITDSAYRTEFCQELPADYRQECADQLQQGRPAKQAN
jgi:hypothetical protein